MTSAELKNVFPDWKIVHEIGHGSFGAVYEIEREIFSHKETAALKVISIPQSDSDIDDLLSDGYDKHSITLRFEEYLQDIVREYSMMADMKGCVNIVYCDDLKYIPHDNAMGWDIFIKMELLTPLIKSLGQPVSDSQVIKVGMDICNALAFCEERNIIHRDIKPQNIFVASDGTYKLGDFGIAKTVERTTVGTKTGTYKYMAPEVYNNQPYSNKADIYSLGLVLYWLLNEHRTPFLPLPPDTPLASEEDKARDKRFSGAQIPEPRHGSDILKKIVLKACAFKPEERYQNASEMLKALKKLSGISEDFGFFFVESEPDAVGEETFGTVSALGETPKAGSGMSMYEVYQPRDDTVSGRMSAAASAEKALKKNEKMRKRKISVLLSVLAVCLAVFCITIYYTAVKIFIPNWKYSDAVSLMNDGQYTEAIVAFQALDGYKDSAEQIAACQDALKSVKYNTAVSLMNEGKYAEAILAFKALDGFKDSSTQISNCRTAIEDENNYEYVVDDSGNAVITKYTGKGDEITIPSALSGHTVTAIGSRAFFLCSSLTSIIIPNSVTSVGDEAFFHCIHLKNIIIPDSVVSIGDRAFYECYDLINLTIPDSVTSIGSFAFYRCYALTNLKIPDSITTISDCLFFYCSSLASLMVPESVTKIGTDAFKFCRDLVLIVLPESAAEKYARENSIEFQYLN